MFENIKSIMHFENVYELFEEIADYETMQELTAEETDFLQSLNDYEPLSFFLINDVVIIVCDSINGDKSGHPAKVEDFISETLDYIRENCYEN